jgi:molybdate transport system ATP-binding protein
MMLDIDIELRLGSFQRHVRIQEHARVVALVGYSGAGKTSVLNAVAGLVRPARGYIEVDGNRLFDSQRNIDIQVHRRGIGYVFQDARLFPHLNVTENLCYGKHHDRRGLRFGFDEVVTMLGIASLLKRRTAGLSGGEAQRVAIGRALLSQPRILLLDEPLSALDQQRREELVPYLLRVRDQSGLPMLYVSHHADEIRKLASAVHVIG